MSMAAALKTVIVLRLKSCRPSKKPAEKIIRSLFVIPRSARQKDLAKELFREKILSAKTILWNGPVGVFEIDKFATGTKAVAEAVVEATAQGAYSLIGGGDSVAAINKFGLADKVSYVSTGGGALLEYMEGAELPGVAAIRK